LPLLASRTTQRSSLQDSHLRLLTETAKREAPLEPGQLVPLAEANLEKLLAMFQENPLAGVVMRPDLPLPRLREMAKRRVLTHFPEEYWPLKNIIARCTPAVAPFALDVVGRVIGAYLLAVTIDAAVRSINPRAAFDHSGLGLGVNIGAILFHLWIEMSDLPIRDHRQSHPGESERAENSEKKRGESFHKCASEPSASTGLRNVGTVDVRPNPKSISPK